MTESDTKLNLDQSVLVYFHLLDYGVQDGFLFIYISIPIYLFSQLIPEHL